MAEINDLNVTDAGNTARWPEGMAPSAVNNAGRADEGLLARWHKDTNASLVATGLVNVFAVAANQTISAYYDGLVIAFDANLTNTGSATLNVDAVAAATIKKHNDVDLAPGDIEAGQKVIVIYDGTNWQMVSPPAKNSGETHFDANGNELLAYSATASAVNELTVTNAATGAAPSLSATGANTDIDLNLVPKGSGQVDIGSGGATTAEMEAATATDKIVTPANLSDAMTLDTPIVTTSGTAHDFTGIRASAKRITIILNEVSLSGTDDLLIQLGDSVGFEIAGYLSESVLDAGVGGQNGSGSTSGFLIRVTSAAYIVSGRMVLSLFDSAANTWIEDHNGKMASSVVVNGGGSKTLSDTMTQVRVTRTGTNTFDAGSVNILVE